MHEHIQTAKEPHGAFHHARAIRRDGAIREDQFTATTERPDRLLRLPGIVVFMTRHEGDIGAVSREGDGGGGSDAAGAAGD